MRARCSATAALSSSVAKLLLVRRSAYTAAFRFPPLRLSGGTTSGLERAANCLALRRRVPFLGAGTTVPGGGFSTAFRFRSVVVFRASVSLPYPLAFVCFTFVSAACSGLSRCQYASGGGASLRRLPPSVTSHVTTCARTLRFAASFLNSCCVRASA